MFKNCVCIGRKRRFSNAEKHNEELEDLVARGAKLATKSKLSCSAFYLFLQLL